MVDALARIHVGILAAGLLLATMSSQTRAQSGSSRNAAVPHIPPISGTVLDAVTGRPILGVDVILRAERASFGGGMESLRYESAVTSADGRFYFPASSVPKAAGILASIGEVSLSVNRMFLSDSQRRAMNPGGSGQIWHELSDVTWLAQHGSLADVEFRDNRIGNRSYFPVSVQFLRDCNGEWRATCLSLSPNESVRIPLIPVLKGAIGCARIVDPESQQRCHELNTYRAAFLHRKTIAQVREDKTICENVDHGRVSKLCLEHLHRDASLRPVSPGGLVPAGSLTPPADLPSLENALILAPVGGLVASSPSLIYADLFDEAANYRIRYSSATAHFGPDPILVAIDLANVVNKEPTDKDYITQMTESAPAPEAGLEDETIEGNKVKTVRRDGSSIITWTSGRNAVSMVFDQRGGFPKLDRAVEAAAAGWPELIRAYLRKYPSH